jgi:hypothetical protein
VYALADTLRSASVKERGLSSVCERARPIGGDGCSWFVMLRWVPHQGVVLRDGSVARHLSAPEGMVRSGHDPQGLNQFVDVATGVGVMPIPSRLGSCPSFTRRPAA